MTLIPRVSLKNRDLCSLFRCVTPLLLLRKIKFSRAANVFREKWRISWSADGILHKSTGLFFFSRFANGHPVRSSACGARDYFRTGQFFCARRTLQKDNASIKYVAKRAKEEKLVDFANPNQSK